MTVDKAGGGKRVFFCTHYYEALLENNMLYTFHVTFLLPVCFGSCVWSMRFLALSNLKCLMLNVSRTLFCNSLLDCFLF